MKKSELLSYLDSLFEPGKMKDSSKNGLQVDSRCDEVWRIGFAVDASAYLIDRAIKKHVDLMVVHHGMFWGYENTVTGLHFERLSALMQWDTALYAMHLPLDAHGTVGNNIGIVNAFLKFAGIKDARIEPFGEYHGEVIGFAIRFQPLPIAKLKEFSDSMKFVFDFYNFGNLSEFSSLAVISGGGGEGVFEASRKGYDVFLTGEGVHHQHIAAKELGQSVLFGGHYETETIGVKLLAKHLKKKFGIEIDTVFLDEKYDKAEIR